MLSYEERKQLHGLEYVKKYQKKSPKRVERLMEFIDLNHNSIVADFGCGNGMLIPLLAPKVFQYKGVDFSEPFIQAAEQLKQHLKFDNVLLECEDIEKFCKKHKDCFDAGFAFDLSEHVYDDEWSIILRNICDSLKPGGKLYIHTPNADFIIEIMKKYNIILKQFKEHVAVRNPCQNISLLNKAGFIKIKLKLIPHYNVLRFLHPLSILPFIGKYFNARIFIIAQK